MPSRSAPALLFVLAFGTPGAQARADADAPVLIELFTSEGCSSCPPADALLARLASERAAGPRVVALSEHVDTWDDLGWRDRFSSPVFTQRQEAYVHRMRARAVYTPQLVVAGRAEVVGSDERAARAAIASAARERPGHLEARLVPGGSADLALAIEAAWSPAVRADVMVALVQEHATSRVERGENAGRTLEHFGVVRSLAVAGTGAGAFSGTARIGRTAAPEARLLVVFVQEGGGGPVLAVTTVELR